MSLFTEAFFILKKGGEFFSETYRPFQTEDHQMILIKVVLW